MLRHTCITIAESNPQKLKKTTKLALKKSKFVEIRFDFLTPSKIPDALNAIKKRLEEMCMYVKSTKRRRKIFGD